MRVRQQVGERGSLKWIQRLVNEKSDVLDRAVRTALKLSEDSSISWRSPRTDDDLAEYRDGSWLTRIGREDLIPALTKFWPSGGPQWDALAIIGKNHVVLVEAKAHLSELKSPASGAKAESSKNLIDAGLKEAKRFFGVPEDHPWSKRYYQYANRLAHLFFLRSHGVDADMLFLYVVGDTEMGGPTSAEGWRDAIVAAHTSLGLPATIDHVHELFIGTGDLG